VASRDSMEHRRRADSWEPKQRLEGTALLSSRARRRVSESRRGARSARTPARPPTLPCSHRRRGTGGLERVEQQTAQPEADNALQGDKEAQFKVGLQDRNGYA